MANPHASPGGFASYTNPAGGMMRRSSYASVLSGAAPTSTQPFNQPTRAGALSYLSNVGTAVGLPGQQQGMAHFRSSTRHLDGDIHNVDGHLSGPYGRAGQLPPYSSQFGSIFGNMSHTNGVDGRSSNFFVPSYLKGSRYMQRLEQAHKAKLSAHRDGRSNGGSLSSSPSAVNLHKMVPSHRGMTHDIIERIQPSPAEEHLEPLPSRWSETDKCAGLELHERGLEVRFNGTSKTSDDAASVRADHPMPRQCGIYYYEVEVLSKGREGLIGIGFSGPKVPLNRLPGWEAESWAYHGDDGYSFCQTPSGREYGKKFSSLDVIGCGVNFRTGCAFFTKNGSNLGIAFRDIKAQKLYPSVGMKKPGEHLKVNFGQEPFVFPIGDMIAEEKALIQADINRTSVSSLHPPLEERQFIQRLVAHYLAHDGYVETAAAFAQEVEDEANTLRIDSPLKGLEPVGDFDAYNRQRIRSAIMEGDIDKALKYTNAYYPNVLRDNENIYFKLRCRKFIEMIRRCNDMQPSSDSAAGKHPETKKKAGNGHVDTSRYPSVFDHDEMDVDGHTLPPTNSNGHTHNGNTSNPDAMDTDSSPKESSTESITLLQETLKYGQELQSEFRNDPRQEVQQALEDTFALIAYENASKSALAPMLEVSGRVPVAEELNGAILGKHSLPASRFGKFVLPVTELTSLLYPVSLGKSSSAALEKLIQQTEVLVQDLSEEGGAAAFINVRDDFMR